MEWFKSRGLLTEFENLQSTGWYKQLLIEIGIVVIAPLPYLDDFKYQEYVDMFKADIQYTYNEILLSFMLFRCYIFVRYSLVASQFMSPRSKRICNINGCEANLMFAMKSIMKQRPYLAILIALLVTIFLFGYQLRLFEGPISAASGQDFNSYNNAMWNVIVTLSTVGYGELYMKTFFGRVVGLIVCFWGTFVVSYFVVTVTNMLTFAAPEEKSYTLLLRLHYKEDLKKYAVNVLTSAFKHRSVRIHRPDDEKKNLSALRKFRGNMLQFQQAVHRVRNYYDGDSEIDILMRLIDNLREDVSLVKEEQQGMTESIEKVISFVKRIELLTVEPNEKKSSKKSSSKKSSRRTITTSSEN
ncbi:hypothetical protein FGO68_gene1047 [Halteria grandinella]|uniref:Potassium channel domain-containing protein n=1 Tax=Halteria grandinella TaxID=5974 RepID=A0A8J8NT95_HALGN|nr:hypothetical protein FGO68_gene1047 [Halteria grandinella]